MKRKRIRVCRFLLTISLVIMICMYLIEILKYCGKGAVSRRKVSCCSTPQGSPGIGRNTFLSSPHLCFIIVFICDLFVSRDDPLMS